MRIAYDAHGLQVRVDGVVLLEDLQIGTWAPQPEWRFGIGLALARIARTSTASTTCG